MRKKAALILLPMVRDLVGKGGGSYLMGVVDGAVDVLERMGLLNEGDYSTLSDMVGKSPRQLLEWIEKDAADEASNRPQIGSQVVPWQNGKESKA